MMEQLGLPPAGARLAPAREGPQAAGCGGSRRQGQLSSPMRTLRVVYASLFAMAWLGCVTTTTPSRQQAWGDAEVECHDTGSDQCVTLLCLGDTCGFYRCEDLPDEVELARFPPARPPAATASPGMGPRRNWGGAGAFPGGAVRVFPNWNGGPERLIPLPVG